MGFYKTVRTAKLSGLPRLQLWGGGGENGDLESRINSSMTEVLGRCGITMQMPWTHVWGARVAQLPNLPQECSPPHDRLPHPQLPHHRMSVAEGSERD